MGPQAFLPFPLFIIPLNLPTLPLQLFLKFPFWALVEEARCPLNLEPKKSEKLELIKEYTQTSKWWGGWALSTCIEGLTDVGI